MTTPTTPRPAPEAVEAARYFVNPDNLTMDQWVFACDKMLSEIVEIDQGRGAPQLAAAARILAAEVEWLRYDAQASCGECGAKLQ